MNLKFHRVDENISYFCGALSNEPVRKNNSDWRYYITAPSKNNNNQEDNAFPTIRSAVRLLRAHSQWFVMNNIAVDYYIDHQSDLLLEECVRAHKHCEKLHHADERPGSFNPAPDEWMPFTLVSLHNPPL
jgi:hypothetical protein